MAKSGYTVKFRWKQTPEVWRISVAGVTRDAAEMQLRYLVKDRRYVAEIQVFYSEGVGRHKTTLPLRWWKRTGEIDIRPVLEFHAELSEKYLSDS